ncbi:MAG: tRNA pseudouridine(55) synthase TruB [Anaerolineae bacterium]|nr:tRNA pseudouridine(55) synthase TruB [Anaerolineae bacterium]
MINGVLIVDKPAGLTSHDVVNRVRRLAGTRRVGHTGTLDPMATGVLGLLLGPATRLSQFATEGTKQYRAVLRFGQTTDTYDADGEIIAQQPVEIDLRTIESIPSRFEGTILQVPPMYSAIKVHGTRLYERARRGEEVERDPRLVTVYSLTILDWVSPDLTFDVACSSGTYIRSLAHDIGQALGCGGHLRALRRTASGPFTLEQSRSLDDLQHLQNTGRFGEALLPATAALGSMPVMMLTPDQERAVRFGQTIALTLSETAGLVQAQDSNGELVAVLRHLVDHEYRPLVVLPPCTGCRTRPDESADG